MIAQKEKFLPCGSRIYFDHETECSYRCMDCFAVVGSIGMPRECFQLLTAEQAAKMLGSKDAD